MVICPWPLITNQAGLCKGKQFSQLNLNVMFFPENSFKLDGQGGLDLWHTDLWKGTFFQEKYFI